MFGGACVALGKIVKQNLEQDGALGCMALFVMYCLAEQSQSKATQALEACCQSYPEPRMRRASLTSSSHGCCVIY